MNKLTPTRQKAYTYGLYALKTFFISVLLVVITDRFQLDILASLLSPVPVLSGFQFIGLGIYLTMTCPNPNYIKSYGPFVRLGLSPISGYLTFSRIVEQHDKSPEELKPEPPNE